MDYQLSQGPHSTSCLLWCAFGRHKGSLRCASGIGLSPHLIPNFFLTTCPKTSFSLFIRQTTLQSWPHLIHLPRTFIYRTTCWKTQNLLQVIPIKSHVMRLSNLRTVENPTYHLRVVPIAVQNSLEVLGVTFYTNARLLRLRPWDCRQSPSPYGFRLPCVQAMWPSCFQDAVHSDRVAHIGIM